MLAAASVQRVRVPLEMLIEHSFLGKLYDLVGSDGAGFDGSIAKSGGAVNPIRVLLRGERYEIWDGYSRVGSHRRQRLDTILAELLPESFRHMTDAEAIEWSEIQNEYRRHLSKLGQAQKYLAALRAGKTTAEAAETAGYSSRQSAMRAAEITENAEPEVAKAWSQGELSQRDALDLADQSRPKQMAGLRKAKERPQRRKAEPTTAKEKVDKDFSDIARKVDALYSAMAAAGLWDYNGSMNEDKIAAVVKAGKKEIGDAATWTARVATLARGLKAFSVQISEQWKS